MARVLALIGILVLWISSCSPAPPKARVPVEKEKSSPPSSSKPSEKKKPPRPKDSFKDLEYVFWRSGKSRWWIRAEEARRLPDRLEMKRPFVRSLERSGLELSALKGIYLFKKRVFSFRERVVLHTPDRGTLYTDRLYYWPEKKLLSGDRPLILKDKGLLIRGEGFEYDLESGKLRIQKKTRVEFHG